MPNANRRIKICFLIDQLTSIRGGTEQHLAWLSTHLPNDRFVTNVLVLSGGGPTVDEAWPFVCSHVSQEIGGGPLNWLRRLRAVKGFLQRNEVDIIHSMCHMSELVSVLSSSFGRTTKVVGSRRNTGYALSRARIMQSRLINRYVFKYIANSEAAKNVASLKESIPSGRITVIPNPISETRIKQARSKDFDRTKLAGDNELIVAMVGTIRPIKDHETLLHAARSVVDRINNVRFVMIGEKEAGFEDLVRLTSNLSLTENVLWYGGVDNPFEILRYVDVAVLTSLSESFSNAVLEYAAAGIPAVVTDVGALREIVLDHKTGFVVRPGSPMEMADRIVILLRDAEMRLRFGIKAKAHAFSCFAEARILSQYCDFYRQVLGESVEDDQFRT